MEVHHHPHTERKRFKHYLWEFLMLFLAVFCGFLAEYQLENKIEKDKAKQFIVSFYEDLNADTIKINSLSKYDNEKIAALSDMVSCYDAISKNNMTTECLVELLRHSKSNRSFQATDRTLKQLTYAGGFRLLYKEDADSILGYQSLFKDYQDFEATIFQSAQDNVRGTTNELFSFKNIHPMLQQNISLITNIDTTRFDLQGRLTFSDDKFLLNKWFNELTVYLRVTKAQLNLLFAFKEKASRLLIYFKQKYHFA